MKSVISSSLSAATAHPDRYKKTVVHQALKANHQCGCAQLPAMTWESGKCVIDDVALSATERGKMNRAILPAMPALKDFECHASPSTFCAVLLGYEIGSRSVEIRNETGDILLVLPFSEAVKRAG
ncbi:hypothetical protein [Rhizobium leguminosarum]|uniref:hypothetical protein n=1 Tax=Rhizobium leguminosarum TaxID=384 RepID=UPI001FE11E6B|nr:hypothetical protein [Rhizobium leguminosarum]